MNKLNNTVNRKETLAQWLQNRMLIITVVMILAFMISQFVILGSVGTMGPQISQLRAEREQIKLDNEIKQSKIREYQTNDRIIENVSAQLEVVPKGVINLSSNSIPDERTTAYGN